MEHLEELYLCNRYYDYEKREWIESKNNGFENILSTIPSQFEKLPALKVLFVGGDNNNHWGISDCIFFGKAHRTAILRPERQSDQRFFGFGKAHRTAILRPELQSDQRFIFFGKAHRTAILIPELQSDQRFFGFGKAHRTAILIPELQSDQRLYRFWKSSPHCNP